MMLKKKEQATVNIGNGFTVTGLVVLMAMLFSRSLAEEADSASLFERLGGLAHLSLVVSDLIDVMVPDPQLSENPAIGAARQTVPAAYLKYQVRAMVCEATGGPCRDHGRDM